MSVFISYRRDGGKKVAESIYQALHDEYAIFLDTETLKNGCFDVAIVEQIKACSDFLLIITETIFNRCMNSDDWILNEAQIALKEKKNIIPVFVGIQQFPSNIPKQLKELLRYNGIFWKDDDETYKRIKTFLISNRRYILSAERFGEHIVLSADSKKDLHEIYQRIRKNGRRQVDIEIRVDNIKELSELIIREDVRKAYGCDFAEQLAEQSMRERIAQQKKVLEIAIEKMIQYELLDACALKLDNDYEKKYGLSNCIFQDENGINYFDWTVFLWIEIVEELFKELLFDRYYVYANDGKTFTAIDCYVMNNEGKVIWNYVSFIKRFSDEKAYAKLMSILSMPGGRADFLDIPLHSLAYHVYPDLFYNIGLLEERKTNLSFEAINQYKNAFNLMYYWFGLH